MTAPDQPQRRAPLADDFAAWSDEALTLAEQAFAAQLEALPIEPSTDEQDGTVVT